MNSWLILLFLLLGNQNSRCNNGDFGCGCYNDYGRGRGRDNDNGCDNDYGRGRGRDNDCGCDNDYGRGTNRNFERGNDIDRNNDSRFEPCFDSGSFDNSDCGGDN